MIRYYQYVCEPGMMRQVLKRTRTTITYNWMTAAFGYDRPQRGGPITEPVKGNGWCSGNWVQGKRTERRWNDWNEFLDGSAED